MSDTQGAFSAKQQLAHELEQKRASYAALEGQLEEMRVQLATVERRVAARDTELQRAAAAVLEARRVASAHAEAGTAKDTKIAGLRNRAESAEKKAREKERGMPDQVVQATAVRDARIVELERQLADAAAARDAALARCTDAEARAQHGAAALQTFETLKLAARDFVGAASTVLDQARADEGTAGPEVEPLPDA